MAGTNIEPGVGLPCRERVVKLPVDGLIRIDAVVSIADSGQIAAAIAVDARPVEAIACVMARCDVLDHNIVRYHLKAILERILPVQYHSVPVVPAYGDVRRFHRHGFVIYAVNTGRWPNGDQVSRLR